MSRGLFFVGLVAVSVFVLGTETHYATAWSTDTGATAAQQPRSIELLAPADTIRSTIPAGTPLVRSLPSEWNGASVSNYAIVEGPALSGVAGKSFTWITRGMVPGTYDVRLRASHPDVAPDTLVLQIEVEE